MLELQTFGTDLYVATTNQLTEMVCRVTESKRPIVTVKLPTMSYTIQCMTRLKDDWYYFVGGDILIVTEFERRNVMTFFCINMSLVDIELMQNISEQVLYGVNRSYALNSIVNTVKSEVIDRSYSWCTLEECGMNLCNITNNIRYVGESNYYSVFTAHVLHRLMKCSVLMYVSRVDGFYFDYVCIRDDVIIELIKKIDNAIA